MNQGDISPIEYLVNMITNNNHKYEKVHTVCIGKINNAYKPHKSAKRNLCMEYSQLRTIITRGIHNYAWEQGRNQRVPLQKNWNTPMFQRIFFSHWPHQRNFLHSGSPKENFLVPPLHGNHLHICIKNYSLQANLLVN